MKNIVLLLTCSFLFCIAAEGQNDPSKEKPASDNCEIRDLAISAALGDVEAQYNLGVEFHRGDKVPQDLAKAAILWRLATKAGYIYAFNNLGHLTYYGRGIKSDPAEGVRLWRYAAVRGLSEPQIHLAYAYTDRKYLKPDYTEAYAWATAGRQFGSAQGDADDQKAMTELADEALKIINDHISATQLVIAKKRAALYIAQYAPKERF